MPDSRVPREDIIPIGGPEGAYFLPASEWENYVKGFRQMGFWGAVALAPFALLVLLIYFW
jgi:hypothetical protein